jgi:hypothetical protein
MWPLRLSPTLINASSFPSVPTSQFPLHNVTTCELIGANIGQALHGGTDCVTHVSNIKSTGFQPVVREDVWHASQSATVPVSAPAEKSGASLMISYNTSAPPAVRPVCLSVLHVTDRRSDADV